ncbi:MAG: PAS domain-containing protein [Myxococcales bacterium]|nr:PAS domain-containing protein [Myxococcales bacterium]
MPITPHTPPSRPRPIDLPGGEIDGRYVVEGEIARGGTGRVLKVRHRELDKGMALKLLGAAGSDRDARAAFYREARLAAALDHPHIAQVYDFGDDRTRGLYLVMELLDGETAAQRVVRDGKLAPIAACDIATQAAEALEYIHGRGLVHGDVKPANVFLSRPKNPLQVQGRGREARRTFVRLLDFGLARPAQTRARRPTPRKFVEGSPAYLAPELITGGQPSPASDLYALGVSLFELLAGRPPLVGALGDVMAEHLRGAAPTVSKVRGEALSGPIEAIVKVLMAKSPVHRPSDARTAVSSLRACVASLGGRRKSPPREQRHSLVFQAVVDGMPIGMFVANRAGVILFSNPALERLLGSPSDDVHLAASPLGEAFPGIEADARQVLLRGRPLRRRGSGPDGRALHVTLSPHRRDGETIGVSGMVDEVALRTPRTTPRGGGL